MRRVGYIRLTGSRDRPIPQEESLRLAGCEEIVTDQVSDSQLLALVDRLKPGDTLAVWSVAHLGGSIAKAVEMLAHLSEVGISITALKEDFRFAPEDTSLRLCKALALARRKETSASIRKGMKDSAEVGSPLGRPKRLDQKHLEIVRFMRFEQRLSIEEIAKRLQIGRSTLKRYLAQVR